MGSFIQFIPIRLLPREKICANPISNILRHCINNSIESILHLLLSEDVSQILSPGSNKTFSSNLD